MKREIAEEVRTLLDRIDRTEGVIMVYCDKDYGRDYSEYEQSRLICWLYDGSYRDSKNPKPRDIRFQEFIKKELDILLEELEELRDSE